MEVIFNITKGDESREYSLDTKTTFDEFKKKIIHDFALPVKYIDIEFLLERPIRTLGKFNLEPGILPRPLDIHSFEHFGLDGRNINATFTEVDNYTPLQNKRGIVKLRNRSSDNIKYAFNEDTYDLQSNSDFPTL